MTRILIVEDKAPNADLLKRHLKQSGYQVRIATRGKEALEMADHGIDLILLDLMLPDIDDLSLCEELRKLKPSRPIIIISIINDSKNKVQALHSCADDYVVKPFDVDEVLERINIQLRHAQHIQSNLEKQIFTLGPLSINFEQRQVIVNNQEISLTHTEYELLHILVINYGRIVTYDILLAKVWADEYTSEYKSIHTFISHLRKKIEFPAQCRFIHNEPKIGYRFKAVQKIS